MKSLVITPKNEKDLEFLKNLISKLGYSISELSEEELEDLGLLKAMVKEKKGDYVSEKDIRKTLKRK
jgi:hypothetical protein